MSLHDTLGIVFFAPCLTYGVAQMFKAVMLGLGRLDGEKPPVYELGKRRK